MSHFCLILKCYINWLKFVENLNENQSMERKLNKSIFL